MRTYELDSDGDNADKSARTTESSRRMDGPATLLEHMLDITLEDTFPCSDPISSLTSTISHSD
jgi:hypothetical protein